MTKSRVVSMQKERKREEKKAGKTFGTTWLPAIHYQEKSLLREPRSVDSFESLTKLTCHHCSLPHGPGNSASRSSFLEYKKATNSATAGHTYLFSKQRRMFSVGMLVVDNKDGIFVFR